MGDSFVGLQARLMSQALRKLTAGDLEVGLHGDLHQPDPREDRRHVRQPETTTGGRALKFYASVRLDIRRIGQLKEGEEVIGNRTKVTGGQEQDRAPVPEGRVRHPVQPRHQPRGRAPRDRARRRASC
jgi:RecA/RadA recombinase